VVNSRIDQIDCFMDRSVDQVLALWQSHIELGRFPTAMADIAFGLYKQVLATGLGDKSVTALDMIYVGLEDGRFVGYFSPTSYTERAATGRAADLPWAPYTMDTVNGVCADTAACAAMAALAQDGTILGEACTAKAGASQAEAAACARAPIASPPGGGPAYASEMADADAATCAAAGPCAYSLYGGRGYGGQVVAEVCPAGERTGSCTTSCCDGDVRNYYGTSTEINGAVRPTSHMGILLVPL
jgi:hypothetical protein